MPATSRLEAGLEIALLAAAGWPALRASLSPPFWRAHVRPALVSAAAVAGLAVLAIVLAVDAPIGLRALVALVCAFRVVGYWRSRPGFGRSRGLPPGRLSFLPPLGAVTDPDFLTKQAAAHGPVFKIGGFRRNVVCVVGLARAAAVLRRDAADLTVPAMPFSRAIPLGFLRFMGRSDHATFRRLIQRGLSREFVDGREASLRRAVAGGLAAMARAGGSGGTDGIAPAPFLGETTFACLLELIFGVGRDDPHFGQLERTYRGIDHLSVSPLSVRRARRELAAVGEIARERACGHRGLLGEIAATDAAMADDPTLIGNLAFMVRASGTDLAGLLAWLLSLLAGSREWLPRLRSELARGAGGGESGLASRIASEALRLQQSEYVNRIAAKPIEIDGFTVPRGWAVRICVRESHRDSRVFESPDSFDPDRFLGRDPRAGEYAPFGMDSHSCVGEHLTRTVSRIFVEELACGYDLDASGNGPAEMGRAHWQPNRWFRVRLTPRS